MCIYCQQIQIYNLQDIAHFLRLWYHECCRVFQDRLVNDQDRNWFNDLLHERINIDFEQDSNEVLGNQDILFGDFMDSTSDDRPYLEITNMEKVIMYSFSITFIIIYNICSVFQ